MKIYTCPLNTPNDSSMCKLNTPNNRINQNLINFFKLEKNEVIN